MLPRFFLGSSIEMEAGHKAFCWANLFFTTSTPIYWVTKNIHPSQLFDYNKDFILFILLKTTFVKTKN